MPSNSTTPNDNIYTHSPSPIYGIAPGFNISDIGNPGTAQAIASLAGITTTTTSATIPMGCRFIELDINFNTAGAHCQIDVYTSKDTFTDPVFTGIATENTSTTSMYVGNFENVNLAGYDVKVKVSALSAGTVTVSYRKTG
jgi:hypothetical protein